MVKQSFVLDGVSRVLFECNDKWAIYFLPDGSFELHKVRWRSARSIDTLSTPIVFPSGFVIAATSEFGLYGWHLSSLERCYQKLVELNLLCSV